MAVDPYAPRPEDTADYYKRLIPQSTAEATAKNYGISTDQLYQALAANGNPNVWQNSAQMTSPGVYGPQRGSWGNVDLAKIIKQQQAKTAQPTTPAQQQSYYQAPTATIRSGSGTIGGSGTTANGLQPEQVALQQMAQIDPTSEKLRNQLGSSYLSSLSQTNPTAALSMPGVPVKGAPSAADVQSYLDTYKQIDPTGLAGRQQLEQQLTSQAALGSKLDPETAREIAQQTRLAQTARGNVYGTPQLVQEAVTRGEAGLALQQQRQQALQGFYSSGQDVGNVANQLYQQGQQNYLNQYQNYLNSWNAQNNAWLANQQNQRANQATALGYLTSGATPYQVGSGYLANTEQRAANAAMGGPQYNPSALGQTYTGGGAGYFPDYGLNTSQNAQGWFNSLSAYNQPYGRSGGGFGGAASGALSGGLSGATAGATLGSVIPGVGTAIGGIVGGAMGALGGGLRGYSG